MTEAKRENPTWGVTIFVALMISAILLRISPVQTAPGTWVMPDGMLVLACLYAARKPRYMPMLAVICVFLLGDLLFQQIPGLRTLLVLAATEVLRRQSKFLRAGTLTAEWLTVGATIGAVIVFERMIMALLLVPLPPLTHVLMGGVLSIACYPLVALVAGWALGLHRRAPGELDYRGQKL